MHQLLWDASNVHAGPAQAPGRAYGRRLDEVTKANVLAESGGLFSGREASGASTNDLKDEPGVIKVDFRSENPGF